MRRAILYIVLFLQVVFMGHVQAQNGTVFPVDLNVTLTPPYGPCLDDYVGIGGNRFLCNVLFRDQMKDKTSPVFEYVIEMKVRTMGGSTMIKAWSEDHKAVLGAVEHFDGGRLMKEFLSETNHTGGSTCLKEGPYTMTFRVYDAVSYNHGRGKGIPISQEFSFSVFVDKGAAPELFNPANKERLSTTTQMVNFQWQLPYVASGMNTYKFVLARIPQGGNANTDIDNPSYQIRNESVTFPMVQVPVTTLFGYEAQGDGSYAWQVTVCDAEGKQRTNYENQGKSKVFTFTFNDEVWLPDSFVTVAPFVKSINKNLDKLTIDSVEVDNETGAARWTNANLGDADSYHGSIIEVRKKGQDKWTPYTSDELKSGDDEQQLPNLKKGVEYEARGQYYQMDNGDTVYAPYGEIVPFTVPSDIDTMNCADDLPALTDCGDAQPKEIHPGDTIIANGKRVFVDSVSYNGDRLTGSGHLDFPIIKCFKFRMQFKNIKVNCAGELVDGEITSVYDMTNAFILDLNNLTGKGNSGDETFNSTEPTVSKVKNLDNAKKTKQPGDYFEVEGEPNVIYSLDKDKNPVKIGTKLANWTSDTFTHANKMYNNEILLKFSNDRKDQGFDSSEEPYRLMAPSKYESVDGYWVPWLASNPGRVCVVKAKLEGGSISNVKDPEHDVKFVMPLSDGGLMELNTQYNAGSGEFEITVMGSSKAGDKLEIYAVIKKTDGKKEEYVDAGRLYVPIYEYRTLKMTLVKVNGANASAVDKSSVESYLNEVYGRIGISFEVTVEEFQSEEAKEFLEDGLDVCGAGGFMTATTDEMRQLKRLYMDSKGGSVDEKRLYLFLVNKAQCSEEDSKIDPSAVCGDMPRNSKVGYLFAENTGDQASFNRTVAHELGHGAFTYEHPFDNAAYTVDQGTTHNLMDYVKDDDLAYFQWQSTLGLNLTWGFLEGDEDGMYNNKSESPLCFVIEDEIYKFDDKYNGEGKGAIYATLLTGKEIEIELKKIDDTKEINFDELVWKLDDNIIEKEDDPQKRKIKLDNNTLKKAGSNLVIFGKDGKGKEVKVSMLRIQPYSPIITFSPSKNYKGEYLYDNGFDLHDGVLQNPDLFRKDYKSFKAGFDDKTVYAPVIGIQKDQSVELSISIDKESLKYIVLDRKFLLEIVLPEDVEINGDKKKISLNSEDISKGIINIKSTEFIENSALITANIPSLNNKEIGGVELFCRKMVELECNLIFVKFSDESDYPKLNIQQLQNYLNNQSLNQLFVKIELNTMYFESSLKKENLQKIDNSTGVYIRIYGEYKYKKANSNIEFYNDEDKSRTSMVDYYFITNIDFPLGSSGEKVKGAHWTGKQGGFQTKFIGEGDEGIRETIEETFAHEYGHWLGLKHCFKEKEENPNSVTKNKGETEIFKKGKQGRGNFMDYNVIRGSWFRYQLIDFHDNRFKKNEDKNENNEQ